MTSRLSPHRLIYTDWFRSAVAAAPLSYADVGARGALEEPWASVPPEALRVIGFEPDTAECERLNQLHGPARRYLPVGLWSHDGELAIHVAATSSCSSVHPPNFPAIERFHRRHWEPRVTRERLTYPCTTLDGALDAHRLGCDFLKIDTQGAEYEILLGARDTLATETLGVLMETWTTEVHQGQRLTGELMQLMHAEGFQLFDVNVAAAWRRRASEAGRLPGKQQVIGLDLLFFKDPAALRGEAATALKALKAAAIAEVYGFPDYAVEVLEAGAARLPADATTLLVARDRVVANGRLSASLAHRIERKLRGLFGMPMAEYPTLHG